MAEQGGGDLALVGGRARTHGRAGDGQAAAHDLGQADAVHAVAGLDGDQEQAPVLGQAVEVALKIGASDQVEDGVNTAAAGQAAYALDEILAAIVDGGFGAQREAGCAFFRRAGGGVWDGAEAACELDRGAADAAGAAMDQHRLAGRQAADAEQVGPDGEIGLGQACRAHGVEAGRPGQALRQRGCAIFRIAAAIDQGADAVAHGETGGVGADGGDLAGNLQSENRACVLGRRIKAAALHDVRPVDAGGHDADDRLAFARHRQRALLDLHDARVAVGLAVDEAHDVGLCHPIRLSLLCDPRDRRMRLRHAPVPGMTPVHSSARRPCNPTGKRRFWSWLRQGGTAMRIIPVLPNVGIWGPHGGLSGGSDSPPPRPPDEEDDDPDAPAPVGDPPLPIPVPPPREPPPMHVRLG